VARDGNTTPNSSDEGIRFAIGIKVDRSDSHFDGRTLKLNGVISETRRAIGKPDACRPGQGQVEYALFHAPSGR
jgi:hypothetical protein